MEYRVAIAEHLIAAYERRGLYDLQGRTGRQRVFLDVKKLFPEYEDLYDDAYLKINEAVELFRNYGVLNGEKDRRGSYGRLALNPDRIGFCYQTVGRRPLGDSRARMENILELWDDEGFPILQQFRESQLERLRKHKPLEFGIGEDEDKLQQVLAALPAVLRLDSETYIRNFSEAVFSDSKQFQKIRGCVESVLCRYGGEELTRDTVLESFNLLDNPSYIMLKGQIELQFDRQSLYLGGIPGGIALPSQAVGAVTGAILTADRLISVENLTTYHDQGESGAAVLYLGGFHNSIRTELLRKIYGDNPLAEYCHKGDLDVFGFLILENLKEKTQIPFQAQGMDLQTLQEYEARGLVKPLEAADRKLLRERLPRLEPYREVLDYMLEHNCKAEQEAEQALALLV